MQSSEVFLREGATLKQERDSSFVAYEGHRGLCGGCLKGRNEAVPLGDVAALSMHDTCGGEDGRKGHTDRRVGEGTAGSCDRTWGRSEGGEIEDDF